jgi:hypothetical protein
VDQARDIKATVDQVRGTRVAVGPVKDTIPLGKAMRPKSFEWNPSAIHQTAADVILVYSYT